MKRFITLFLTLAAVQMSFAQISITSSSFTYSQDFNTLVNSGTATTNTTLPAGWVLLEKGASTRNNTAYAVDNGATNSGDTYSVGATASTERGLGSIRSGTLSPLFGVSFANNTGATITSISVSYHGETWRVATINRMDSIKFEYAIGATGIDTVNGTWVRVPELDYINPGQGTVATGGGTEIHSATISYTITGLNIPSGTTFYFRFNDANATGADDMTAVDDFQISMLVIPVELVKFAAQKDKSATKLTWTTATELNNAFYAIERSADGKDFEKIGEVSGYGNSQRMRDYAFMDEKPSGSVNYYRLRQVDFNGKETVSKTVSVNFDKTASIKVYPAIASDKINVEINSDGAADLTIVNLAGQVMKTQKVENTEGVLPINISDLPNGSYIIRLVSKNGEMTKRFEKQ